MKNEHKPSQRVEGPEVSQGEASEQNQNNEQESEEGLIEKTKNFFANAYENIRNKFESRNEELEELRDESEELDEKNQGEIEDDIDKLEDEVSDVTAEADERLGGVENELGETVPDISDKEFGELNPRTDSSDTISGDTIVGPEEDWDESNGDEDLAEARQALKEAREEFEEKENSSDWSRDEIDEKLDAIDDDKPENNASEDDRISDLEELSEMELSDDDSDSEIVSADKLAENMDKAKETSEQTADEGDQVPSLEELADRDRQDEQDYGSEVLNMLNSGESDEEKIEVEDEKENTTDADEILDHNWFEEDLEEDHKDSSDEDENESNEDIFSGTREKIEKAVSWGLIGVGFVASVAGGSKLEGGSYYDVDDARESGVATDNFEADSTIDYEYGSSKDSEGESTGEDQQKDTIVFEEGNGLDVESDDSHDSEKQTDDQDEQESKRESPNNSSKDSETQSNLRETTSEEDDEPSIEELVSSIDIEGDHPEIDSLLSNIEEEDLSDLEEKFKNKLKKEHENGDAAVDRYEDALNEIKKVKDSDELTRKDHIRALKKANEVMI
jgi:hypothetical protein